MRLSLWQRSSLASIARRPCACRSGARCRLFVGNGVSPARTVAENIKHIDCIAELSLDDRVQGFGVVAGKPELAGCGKAAAAAPALAVWLQIVPGSALLC